MQNLTLLSYSYPNDDFNLLFYDKEQEKLVSVPSDENYLPYLLTRDQKIPKSKKIVKTDFIKRYDGVRHKDQIYKKVCVGYAKPNDIKYLRNRLRNYWEGRILFHENYAYDHMLIYGCEHEVNGSEIRLPFGYENDDLESFFGRAFEQELVNYKRCALDIEVEPEDENKVPDAFKAEQPVLEIAIVGSDGKKYVLLLDTEDKTVGNLEYFSNEGHLLTRCFEILEDYPFIVTLNGDQFDILYIFNRSKKFKVETPIFKKRDYYTLRNHIHIDIMKFYQNRSIKTYVFKDKYKNSTLKELALKLLNKQKFPMPDLKTCTPEEIAHYGLQDAKLTLELTTFNNNLTMNCLTMLCRIANMDMELVNRKPISTWIRSSYHFFHRILGYVVPNEKDFKRFNMKKKGKFKGAIVLKPEELGTVGAYFNVRGFDFGSLYPSCVDVRNISYDTLRCNHSECEVNIVPENEDEYICTQRDGILKKFIGTFRRLRLYKYKKQLKNEKDEKKKTWLEAISGALKVFLNAGYGVFGSEEIGDLFAYDVVKCVPAYGRASLKLAMEKAKEMGIRTLNGHTDSLYTSTVSDEQAKEFSEKVSELLEIDFEIQGLYKFASFWRAGNYLTVESGTNRIRVVGLMGKKSHMGAYFKQRFEKLKDLIKTIEDEETLKNVKLFLQKLAKNSATDINDEKVPLEDLAFEIKIHKNPDEGSGQYYEVAKMLNNNGYEVKAGDTIRFIPTLTEGHSAMPLEMIKSWNIVNKGKLVELLANVMNQVMVPLGLDAHISCQGLKESKLSDYS